MSSAEVPIFPHTSHVDPYSLPFYPLPGHASKGAGARDDSTVPPACSVTLLHAGYLHSKRGVWADDAWDENDARRAVKREQPYSLPIIAALLKHGDETWLWDLGMRNDAENLPEVMRDFSLATLDLPQAAQVHNLVQAAPHNVDLGKLSGVILSHAHVDHYGALDLIPASVPAYVGAGTMAWINGGDEEHDRGGLKSFPSRYLRQGRRFVEVGESRDHELQSAKVGPFEEAFDLFGDQSAYLVKAEGHCHGHLGLLVHTGDSHWCFLAGDAAHEQSLYLPIPSHPYSHSTDRRSVPGQFKMGPNATGFTCMQDMPENAWRTLAAMTRLEMEDNIMVVLAHEAEFVSVAGLDSAGSHDLSRWHQDDLKQKKSKEGDRVRAGRNNL